MKLKIAGTILVVYLLLPTLSFAQSKVIQGSIKGASDGEPLIGATIIETDNTERVYNAAITDYNGQFVIPIKDPNHKLVFNYLGYITKTFPIGDKKTLNVTLAEDTKEISEVLVTAERNHSDGTFSIPQKEVSTAVQTVTAKSLEGVAVTSIDDALQGRVAGFDIVSNSGDLGAGTSMRIRGTTSINANAQPLIVLNGIPYEVEIDPNFDFSSANEDQFASMLSINPDDIEEITVLKDASSTAVWGSKGANGVLVIKTKRGTAGPTRVQYSYRVTGRQLPEGLKMLNGDDYTMLVKQAYFNPQQDENAANVREFLYDQSWSEYENFNNNTDWVNEVTKIGIKNDHYLTITGGGSRARFRMSGGYLTESGTVIGQKLSRYSTRAYLDYSVSDRIKFISEVAFTYTDNARNYSNLLSTAYRKMPNVSVYQQDQDGNNTDEFYNIDRNSSLDNAQRSLNNPVAVANLASVKAENYRIQPTFRLQYDLLDPEVTTLRYKMYVTFDVNNDKNTTFVPQEISNNAWNSGSVNRSDNSDRESMTVMANNNITWEPFKNETHSLLLYGAMELRTGNSIARSMATTNLPTSQPLEAYSEGYLDNIGSSRYFYRSNALTARGHYSLFNRYIFGFTFRRDGSTKFGEDNKYGNFPGVSAKWIISDEPFMFFSKNWLSMFAIRPSWGLSGNQPGGEYLHFSRYGSYGSYIDMPASRPSTLQLSGLKWETTQSFNMGVDLAFFDHRLVFDLNFYNKRTKDLLFNNLNVPSTSGFGTIPTQNVGVMDNNGWELNLYTNRGIKFNDFSMDINFNISNYVNTIVELRDDVLAKYNTDFNYENGSYLTRIQEGNSYGSIYGFKYKGVYQYNEYIEGSQESAPVVRDKDDNVLFDEDGETIPMYFAYGKANEYEFRGGDAIYEDINSDGNIDELDIVYLGNSNPKFNGGFGPTFRYKNFSVNAFFNYRYGNLIINRARMLAENMYSLDNQSTAVNWRWRKDGDETTIPRALYRYGYNWLGSDRFIEDGSFLRFKYLTFRYSVPRAKLKKLNIETLSCYLTINNIYVWTKYSGVDPEVGYGGFGVSTDGANTPRSKDAVFGVSMTF